MPKTSWRAAGALALGHVLLILVGISQQSSPRLGDDDAAVAAEYFDGPLTRILAGGYVEAVGFLLLLPVLTFLARAVGRRTETGSWAAQTALAAGTGYVVMTLAPGLAAGGAALYGAQQGADLGTVAVVNDVRNFAFLLSLLLLAVHAAGVGISILADLVLPKWLGWSALVTAAVLLVSVPLAGSGAADVATLVWIVWFVALATVMIVRPAATAASEPVLHR
jgi:hypothetical protein